MLKGIIYLLRYFYNSRPSYIFYQILLQVSGAIIVLTNIVAPKYVIDNFLLGDYNQIIRVIIGVVLINLFFGVVSNFATQRCIYAKGKVFIDFQIDAFNKVSSLDYEQIESSEFQDLREKAYKFIYGNYRGFGSVLSDAFSIFGKLLAFVGIIGILLSYNVFIILLIVVLILFYSYIESLSKKKIAQIDIEKTPIERKSMYYMNVTSDFKYGKEIRISRLTDWLSRKYTSHLEDSNEFYNKGQAYLYKSNSVGTLINSIVLAIAFSSLSYSLVKNEITIGNFGMYLSAMIAFSSAMQNVMQSVVDISAFKPYYSAVIEFFNLEPKLRNSNISNDLTDQVGEKIESIEFRNVNFKYPSTKYSVLKNINFKFEMNKTYAIVGKNGAGKSTLIKLLTRIYDPSDGEVIVNGINVSNIDYNYYMKFFATVFQDYNLFSFSVADNIVLDNEFDEERLRECVKMFGLEEKIESLPHGINTYIYKNYNEDGFEPSGGQGQKIVLARAQYQDSQVIILDEPTSSLDPQSEYELYKMFDNITNNKLSIYITHRLSSTKFCDCIIVIDENEIIDYGTHEELMLRCELYSSMYNMQKNYFTT